jgi:chaperonin GroEL (HSP60 family)
MNAKLATVDDRILARVEEGGGSRDDNGFSHSVIDKQRVNSLQFDCGYLSPYFVTDPERMEVVFEDAYLLIHEKELNSKNDLMPLLSQITNSGRPLLMISEDVGSEVLATLVVNKLRGPLRVAAVRSPCSGDQRKRILRDIALLTGGRVITEELNVQLRNVRVSDLGRVDKVTISKNSTVVEGRAELVSFEPEARIPSKNPTSPVPSTRTHIGGGLHGVFSHRASTESTDSL